MPASWYYYRRGNGYTFDLERLRFKFEDIAVIILIVVFLIGISTILYFNKLHIVTLFFVATSAYLFYYARRKEYEN
ncbi:hypothetical protein [Paenibacillus sp. sgz500958]|uniref:hypothetical protein n=1 Tax=Paenibacillus sp. sgz500958 TaxID=3242475 RepID=UPI0036D3C9DA